jgi:hypothetical protein
MKPINSDYNILHASQSMLVKISQEKKSRKMIFSEDRPDDPHNVTQHGYSEAYTSAAALLRLTGILLLLFAFLYGLFIFPSIYKSLRCSIQRNV